MKLPFLLPLISAARINFTEKPRDQFLTIGQPIAVLRCSIGFKNSDKLNQVQWVKDGFGLGNLKNLPEYPRYTLQKDSATGNVDLVIQNVQSEDNGIFECQVRPFGRVKAKITVLSPPEEIKITSPTADISTQTITVIENKPVSINCLVPSSRPGVNLTLEAPFIISPSTTNFLENEDNLITSTLSAKIKPKLSDNDSDFICSGRYRSDEFNFKTIRKTMKLKVLSPPKVELVTEKLQVIEGDELNIQCQSVQASPSKVLKYRLFNRNKQEIDANGNGRFSVKVTREITRVYCQAYNSVGGGELESLDLDVYYGPIKRRDNQVLEVLQGERININCDEMFDSNPKPRFREVGYRFERAFGNHSDFYECEATHLISKNQATNSIFVKVIGDPDVKSITQESSQIKCSYTSFPAPLSIKISLSSEDEQEILTRVLDPSDISLISSSTLDLTPLISSKSLPQTFKTTCQVTNANGKSAITQTMTLSDSKTVFIVLSVVSLLSFILVSICIWLVLIKRKGTSQPNTVAFSKSELENSPINARTASLNSGQSSDYAKSNVLTSTGYPGTSNGSINSHRDDGYYTDGNKHSHALIVRVSSDEIQKDSLLTVTDVHSTQSSDNVPSFRNSSKHSNLYVRPIENKKECSSGNSWEEISTDSCNKEPLLAHSSPDPYRNPNIMRQLSGRMNQVSRSSTLTSSRFGKGKKRPISNV